MGGFLFAGMVVALLAGLAAMFFEIPALALTVSAVVALLSAGMILFETSRIVNGGRIQLRARHGQPLRLDLQPVHQPAQPVRLWQPGGVRRP